MFVGHPPRTSPAPIVIQNYRAYSTASEPLSGPGILRCIIDYGLRNVSSTKPDNEPVFVANSGDLASVVAGFRGAGILFSLAKQHNRGKTRFYLCLRNETDIKVTTHWTLGFFDPRTETPLYKSAPVHTNFERKDGRFRYGVMEHKHNIGIESQVFAHDDVIRKGWVFDGTLHVFADILFKIESGGMVEPMAALSGGLLMNVSDDEFEDPVFSDLTLISSDGQRIKTHKEILRLASPVFGTIFDTERSKTLNIDDADAISIKVFLTYLYKGLLGEPPFKVTKTVFELAAIYQVRSLKHLCALRLWGMINLENAVEILGVADMHGQPRLRNEVFIFLEDNLEEVMLNGALYKLAEIDEELYQEWQLHFFARRNGLPKDSSGKSEKIAMMPA